MTFDKKKELIRTGKYFLFASSAGIIEMALFAILTTFTSFRYWPCYLIALIVSVLWNFTLNRRYTFQSNNNIPIAMIKVLLYYAVFTPISTVLGNYLAEDLMWNGYIVTILNMLCNGITEYLYQRNIVFGNSIDSSPSGKKRQQLIEN